MLDAVDTDALRERALAASPARLVAGLLLALLLVSAMSALAGGSGALAGVAAAAREAVAGATAAAREAAAQAAKATAQAGTSREEAAKLRAAGPPLPMII